ncbi:MAG: anti-sigma factor family protein [Candidatus Acidiferrales bacterium]
MSACRDWNDRLLDYVLGAHPASAAAELEAHLKVCPACAAALPELRARAAQLDSALSSWVAGAAPSSGFRAHVLATTDSSPAPSLALPAWAGAFAAVAIVLLVGVVLPRLNNFGAGSEPLTAPSLSNWRSPTESLMRPPAQDYFRAAPRLGEFYFPLEPSPKETGSENGGSNES